MISIYCDGSSTERAGRAGGWAYIVVRDGEELASGSGGARSTTNNVMELEAAREGVKAARSHQRVDEPVELVTDSRYVEEHLGEEGVTTRWVRGHAGNRWNEEADARAHEAKQNFIPEKVKRRLAKKSAGRLRLR